MNEDISFIPLGGGQRVGASCYYLKLGDANIILDAGTGYEGGLEFEPNSYFLKTTPFIQSMEQINNIFISHAHMDHVGYLLKLMQQSGHANVYMTEITKVLTEYQLYDKQFIGTGSRNEDERLAAKSLLDKVSTVTYMQSIEFGPGRYRATFLPAGHIPGAMMILFEIGERKILYTGDYSLDSTELTPGCMIPEDIDIDTVIMCGLHAKHPDYVKNSDSVYQQAWEVLRAAKISKESVICRISQLSKGIEFLKILNNLNTEGVSIYLDENMMNMVSKMECLSIPLLSPNNKVMGKLKPAEPHIYLSSGRNERWIGPYDLIKKIDFSLHEDFSDMKNFLKKINPKKAVMVHCGKEYSVFDHTIEQELMLDGECRTQFIFAEDEEIYML